MVVGGDPRGLKPVEWMGRSRDDLREMPAPVRLAFGHALHLAQKGLYGTSAKQLLGEFGGLIELIDDFDGDSYRALYTVKLPGVVYVLHVFKKKSMRGIATPSKQLALVRLRWIRAREHYAAHYANQEG